MCPPEMDLAPVHQHTAKAVRLGFIGLGAMGLEMLAAAQGHDDVVVVAGFDVNPSAIASAQGIAPGATFVDSATAVIDHRDVDAVYIATPPALHAELSLSTLAAGKAVFCEKPLAIDLPDGQRMVDAAEASGLVNAVNFALSDRNAVLAIADAIQRDEVGAVLGVEIRVSFPQWPRAFQADARWLAERAQGGFAREVLSHFVYLSDRLVGPVRPGVSSVAYGMRPTSSEVSVHALVFAGEVPVRVSGWADVAAPESYEWTMLGERKSFRLTGWGDLVVSDGSNWTPVPLSDPRGSDETRLTSFAAAVRGTPSTNLADFATALRVQQVIESFHQPSGQTTARSETR